MSEKTSGLSEDTKKTLTIVAGGVAILAVGGLLYYVLSGPADEKKTVKKAKKYKSISSNRFESANLCPGEDGNGCFVTSDVNNRKEKLKTGSQLIKINDMKCAGWTFKKILSEVDTCESPITAQFVEHPKNEDTWTKAETCKKEANKFYKNNKNAEALEKYSEAVELHPTRKEYYGNRVLTYFKAKQYEEALADCKQFEKLDPLAKWQRGVHLHGMTLQNLNLQVEALEKYRLAQAMDPSSKTAEKANNRINEITKQMTRRQSAV